MILPLLVATLLAQSPAPAAAPTLPVLTLEEAYGQAERNNKDLQVARARLLQSDELSKKAWSGYMPQVSFNGVYTYNSAEAVIEFPDLQTGELEEIVLQPRHQLNGTAQATQAVIAPQLWVGIRNAELAEQATKLSVENARREILLATAQLYYGAEGLRRALEVQQRLLSVNAAREKDAEVRFQVGTATKVALLRAQIERARAEQDVKRTRNAYQGAKVALATLLGRKDAGFEVAPPQSPAGLPEAERLFDASARRPDLSAARLNLEAAHGAKLQQQLGFLPNVGAFARYNLSNAAGFTGQNAVFTAGAQLSWNLVDGGLREANIREASARVVESRRSLEGLELKVREELTRTLLDLDTARSNVVTAQEQVRLARESSQLVNSAYEAGASTYLELVDANAALTQAELNVINEELNVELAVLKVARAAGLFDPTSSSSKSVPQR